MTRYGNYELDRKLFQSPNTTIWRGHHSKTRDKVIIKVITSQFPTRAEIARLEHEYKLLNRLNLKGVVKPLELVCRDKLYALVMEDGTGQVLNVVLQGKPLSLDQFLPLAIETVQSLNDIHGSGLIHKDIKPSNILKDIKSHQIKFIDLSIACEISREYQEIRNPEVLEGTLSYIAPEQTGRMNRAIDYRSDYYSLGVTFYEILTGHLPFITDDPMEMVYCHLVKAPLPPHQINNQIPKMVSDVVMKLMSKNSEERYQSSAALLADLNYCLDHWTLRRKIEPRPLAENDVSSKFMVSQTLYGREEEIAAIVDTFEKAAQGSVEMMLVSGEAGVGKTSVINEVNRPLTKRKAFFIKGKFDQLKQNVAYSALGAAFQDFARQLLKLPDEEFQQWREKFLKALSSNAQLIIDLAPEMEAVLGEQMPMIELNPEQAQNRYTYTIRNFITVIATKEHPLVLFFDDLQWADFASIDLLQKLVTSEAVNCLFVIGAYRDNEVMVGHPLIGAMSEIRQSKEFAELKLQPLAKASVNALIADSLYCKPTGVEELSAVVYDKTSGNPFFINEFLKFLYTDKLIDFDFAKGKWGWNLTAIKTCEVASNVVDFLLDRIKKLEEKTQSILQLAACIGNTFDLEMLAIVSKETAKEVIRLLWKAIDEGIVIPISENYRIVEGQAEDEPLGFEVKFKFAHDRVQQAAYLLLPQEKREPVHLQIGWLLYRSLKEEKEEKYLTEVVRHLNEGIALIKDPEQHLILAHLNVKVGKLAEDSAAFKAGLEYFKKSKQLLPKGHWQKEYALTVEVFNEYIKCAYLCGEIEDAERVADTILNNAKSTLEKAHVYLNKTMSYGSLGRHKEAIEASVKGLRLLDYKFNDRPSKLTLLLKLLHLKWMARNVSVPTLIDHVVKYDERNTLIKLFLQGLGSSAFTTGNHLLLAYELMKAMEFLLTVGLSPHSSSTCTSVTVLFGHLGNFQSAHEWAELGTLLNKRYQDIEGYPKTAFQSLTQSVWLQKHWSKIVSPAAKIIQRGMRVGEKMYTSYAFLLMIDIDPYISVPEALKKWEEYYPLAKDYCSVDALEAFVLFRQFLLNLEGKIPEGTYFSDKNYSGIDYLTRSQDRDSGFTKIIYYYYKLRLSVLYEDYETAKECETLSYEESKSLLSSLYQEFVQAANFLIMNISLLRKAKKSKEKLLLWKRIKQDVKKIDKWAKHYPGNFLHVKLFIDAEIASLKGQIHLAEKLYNQAINSAKENDYPFWIAIINEYAGKFYYNREVNNVALLYFKEAARSYQQLGMQKKMDLMQAQYGQLIEEEEPEEFSKVTTTVPEVSQQTTSSMLEYSTVMKASKVLSSEIQLDKLLDTMLRTILENAGAECGVLLLKSGSDWIIQASGTHDEVHVLQNIPLEKAEEKGVLICQQLVKFVTRNRKLQVIGDAVRQGDFVHDPYVTEHQCRSLLCMPLINQNVIRGVLYLENNSIPEAFTKERQHVLESLSSQAAIAIENATLYSRMTELNLSYERFVPKQFLKFLEKESITDVGKGDQIQKVMTVLFADMRAFTERSEYLSSEESFTLVNKFLSIMEPLIHKHGGFIDKYIGDEVMALFPENPESALSCSEEMISALDEFNATLKVNPIRIGIGINSGIVTLGIVGGQARLEGTVISDAVNLASRIEALNKVFGTECLLTEYCVKLLDLPEEIPMRCLGARGIRGKKESVRIYEHFGHDIEGQKLHKQTTKEEFERAVELFDKKKYQQAEKIFHHLMSVNSGDQVVKYFEERCKRALAIKQ